MHSPLLTANDSVCTAVLGLPVHARVRLAEGAHDGLLMWVDPLLLTLTQTAGCAAVPVGRRRRRVGDKAAIEMERP